MDLKQYCELQHGCDLQLCDTNIYYLGQSLSSEFIAVNCFNFRTRSKIWNAPSATRCLGSLINSRSMSKQSTRREEIMSAPFAARPLDATQRSEST